MKKRFVLTEVYPVIRNGKVWMLDFNTDWSETIDLLSPSKEYRLILEEVTDKNK